MFGNLKLRDRALLGYSIPTGLIFVFSGMVYFTATKISETFKQVETTQSTLLEVKSMNVNMVNDNLTIRWFNDAKECQTQTTFSTTRSANDSNLNSALL